MNYAEVALRLLFLPQILQRRVYSFMVRCPLLFTVAALLFTLPLLNGILVLTLGGCLISTITGGGNGRSAGIVLIMVVVVLMMW